MPSRRLIFIAVFVGLIGMWHWDATSAALGQSMPTTVEAQAMSPSVGPQQMIPYGATDGYPTTYPTTDAATYPSTTPSNYSAMAPGNLSPSSPLIAPYASSSPRMASSAANYAMAPATLPSNAQTSDTVDMTIAPQSVITPNDNAYMQALGNSEPWTWQVLPTGLMYKSYLAGNREPRLGSQWVHLRDQGWMWDATLGARAGLIRYGTENRLWPQGYQLDVEGAAFVRMNLEEDRDVDAVDFRAGLIQTTRQGPFEAKFGYYHLSSHLGDEFMVRNPGYDRINYVRESLILGAAIYLNPSVRIYYEAGWCFHTDGNADPWEFQFGIDFVSPEPTGFRGAPFFAINSHLRQENDFGGNMTVQTGWEWRGEDGHLLRIGMQYFNGMSDQYQFYNRFEEQIGMGLWYDF